MPIALPRDLTLPSEDGGVPLAYATKTRHWDIPKDAPDPAENHRDTTLCKTCEETDLTLDSHTLIKLDRFPYRRSKGLHLFAMHLRRAEVALNTLVCTSMFNSYYSGRLVPEMDTYRWTTTNEMPQHASQSLMWLFTQALMLTSTDTRPAKAGLQTDST